MKQIIPISALILICIISIILTGCMLFQSTESDSPSVPVPELRGDTISPMLIYEQDFQGTEASRVGTILQDSDNRYLRVHEPDSSFYFSGRGLGITYQDTILRCRLRKNSIVSGPIQFAFREQDNGRNTAVVFSQSGNYLVSRQSGVEDTIEAPQGFPEDQWVHAVIAVIGDRVFISIGQQSHVIELDSAGVGQGAARFSSAGYWDIDDISIQVLDNRGEYTPEEVISQLEAGDQVVFSGQEITRFSWNGEQPYNEELLQSNQITQRTDRGIRFVRIAEWDGSSHTTAPVCENFRVQATFTQPEYRWEQSLGILFCSHMDSQSGYVFHLGNGLATVSEYSAGTGRRLIQNNDIPLYQERIENAEEITLDVAVYGNEAWFRINGLLVLSMEDADFQQGSAGVTIGREGFSSEVLDISIEEMPEPYGFHHQVQEGSYYSAFSPWTDPVVDDFEDGVRNWGVDTNRSSSGSARVYNDSERGNVMVFDMNIVPDEGHHANVGMDAEANWEDWAGVEFYARAEGLRQAHLSVSEYIPNEFSDRADAFFQVTEQWQRYRFPFTSEYFLPNDWHLNMGSDGIVDFSRISYVFFEVWGYEGEARLFIDDFRLLTEDEIAVDSSYSVLQNFEDSGYSILDETHFSVGDSVDSAEQQTVSPGARGTLKSLLLSYRLGRNPDFVHYDFYNRIPGENWDGISVYLRGEGTWSYGIQLGQRDVAGAPLNPEWASMYCTVPINEEWVEWRIPFDSEAYQFYMQGLYTQPIVEPAALDRIGFQDTRTAQESEVVFQADEIALYRQGGNEETRVAIFQPEPENDSVNAYTGEVAASTLSQNLRSMGSYRVFDFPTPESETEMQNQAIQSNADFYLSGSYYQVDETIHMDVTVFSGADLQADRFYSFEIPAGFELFSALDEFALQMSQELTEADYLLSRFAQEDSEYGFNLTDPLTTDREYWLLYGGSEGEAVNFTETGLALQAAEGPSMVLFQQYMREVRQVSFEFQVDAGSFAFLWELVTSEANNRILFSRLRDCILPENTADPVPPPVVDSPVDWDQWNTAEITMEEEAAFVSINGEQVFSYLVHDFGQGRAGFYNDSGSVKIRDLQISYSIE